MQTPEMHLVTWIENVAGLEPEFCARRRPGWENSISRIIDIGKILSFTGAHGDVAHAAAVEACPGKPPAEEPADAGRPLADHQGIARPVHDGGEINFPLRGAGTLNQDAALFAYVTAGIPRGITPETINP